MATRGQESLGMQQRERAVGGKALCIVVGDRKGCDQVALLQLVANEHGTVAPLCGIQTPGFLQVASGSLLGDLRASSVERRKGNFITASTQQLAGLSQFALGPTDQSRVIPARPGGVLLGAPFETGDRFGSEWKYECGGSGLGAGQHGLVLVQIGEPVEHL